jgi:DNA-directed RNA polymerase alpha subunit
LLSKSEKDLLRMKNFGRKSLNEIRTVFNLK